MKTVVKLLALSVVLLCAEVNAKSVSSVSSSQNIQALAKSFYHQYGRVMFKKLNFNEKVNQTFVECYSKVVSNHKYLTAHLEYLGAKSTFDNLRRADEYFMTDQGQELLRLIVNVGEPLVGQEQHAEYVRQARTSRLVIENQQLINLAVEELKSPFANLKLFDSFLRKSGGECGNFKFDEKNRKYDFVE